jgi:TatD DNase family protein
MLADTHCHLDFNIFDKDRTEVIDRARSVGVVRILNPGINILTSENALKLAQQYPEVYVAVGVHPNEANSWNDETINRLRILAAQPNVVAIGEIGLDYYRDRTPPEKQLKIFKSQLGLAAELGLPVIIHTRNSSTDDQKATSDAIKILTIWIEKLNDSNSELAACPGVLHSFSGDLLSAQNAITLNFCLGITGPVTYKNSGELHRVVGSVPLENLLIETDAPFLTPNPFRGKRNEPAYVKYVAEKIAEIQELSYDVVVETSQINSERIFRW